MALWLTFFGFGHEVKTDSSKNATSLKDVLKKLQNEHRHICFYLFLLIKHRSLMLHAYSSLVKIIKEKRVLNVIDYFNAFDRVRYLQQQVKASFVNRAAIRPITAQHTVEFQITPAGGGGHCTASKIILSSHFLCLLLEMFCHLHLHLWRVNTFVVNTVLKLVGTML